jgi:DNA-binding transcriptional MerR regulator
MTQQFTIHDLEQLTGTKAHTIRVWERRYEVFAPARDKANKRVYNLAQLRQVLDLSFLARNGHRISRIALLDQAELTTRVDAHGDPTGRREASVNDLILAGSTSNTDAFEDILDTCVGSWGIDATILEVIVPYMEKTGLLFYTGADGAIHFAVTALRKKLIQGCEKARSEGRVEKTALLFLPKGEHFDLMLLYTAYRLQSTGIRVLYLGTNVPEESLHDVIRDKQPDLLYTYRHPRQKATRPYGLPTTSTGTLPAAYIVIHAHEKRIADTDGRRMMHYRDL